MRKVSISAIAIMACMLAAASSVAAQDLGEAARLERERKANLTRHVPVITNEDLGRDRIVLPQTETPEVAATPAPSPIVTAPAATTVIASKPAIVPGVRPATVATQNISPQPGELGFSLGDYARKLRAEKVERLAREQQLQREPSAVVASAAKPAAEIHVGSAPARSLQSAKNLPARSLELTNDVAKAVTKNVAGDRAVEVRRGDSLWRISRRHLGRGHLWQLVWKTNPQIANPEVIRVGQTVQLPSSEIVAAALANESVTRVAKAEPKLPKLEQRASSVTESKNFDTHVSPVTFGQGRERKSAATASLVSAQATMPKRNGLRSSNVTRAAWEPLPQITKPHAAIAASYRNPN
jgi:LysM repeat protein